MNHCLFKAKDTKGAVGNTVDYSSLTIYDHAASTQQLTKILALNDVEVVSIGKKSETLEDYFLKLTGEVKYHA